MKHLSLKLKSYASHVNIVDNSNLEKRLLQFLFASLGALALIYVILLSNMVFNIVARKSLEAEARSLGNEVGALELTYLSMSNKIDLNFSKALGFQETKINFATRQSLGNIKMAQNDL